MFEEHMILEFDLWYCINALECTWSTVSTSVSPGICPCAHAVKSSLFFLFFAYWAWQMELGSKWHSYKATPGGDGLVTATSVAIRTECAYGCTCACFYMCVCVCYSRQKCWHTVTSVGDGANSILCEERQKSKKTHQLEDAKEEKRWSQL